MSDSVRPHRRQPTRLPRPWDSPGKTLGWVAISFSNAWKWKVKVKSFSRVWLVAKPWTAAYQAPVSMGFSRQKYWSGVPLPSPSFVTRELQIKHKRDTPAYLFKWLSWGEKKNKNKKPCRKQSRVAWKMAEPWLEALEFSSQRKPDFTGSQFYQDSRSPGMRNTYLGSSFSPP